MLSVLPSEGRCRRAGGGVCGGRAAREGEGREGDLCEGDLRGVGGTVMRVWPAPWRVPTRWGVARVKDEA